VLDPVTTPLHPDKNAHGSSHHRAPQAIFGLVDVLLFPDMLHNIHSITPHAGQTLTDRTATWRTVVVMAATYVGSGVAAVLAVGNSLVANATHVEAEPPQHNDGLGTRTHAPHGGCVACVSAWLGGLRRCLRRQTSHLRLRVCLATPSEESSEAAVSTPMVLKKPHGECQGREISRPLFC
jgi:hypothetical protein